MLKKDTEFSTLTGLIIIAIWGSILTAMMITTISLY